MMRATGMLFMSKTPPTAAVAADGVFNLTLLAYDRLAPQKVEPWRLIYSGDRAQEFWDFCEHEIKPGQPLHIEAERIRIVTLPAPKVPEFQAHATLLQLAPLAHMKLRNKNTAQPSQTLRRQLSITEQPETATPS